MLERGPFGALLNLEGDRIRIDWDSTEDVRFGEITDVIRAESRSDEIASVHATVRHVLLLLCCCVLFARADPVDHRTKSCLFPYLGAETVGRIAWTYPVYDFLVESLDSYSKNRKTGYITGCAIMLQVWLFEHTTLWAPSAPDAHPRLLKWITGIDTRRSDHAALIRQIRDRRLKKTQVVRCLLPLPREEGLLSFTADEADTVMGEKLLRPPQQLRNASQYTSSPYTAFGTKKVNDKALLVADPQCHRLLPKVLALPPSERVIQVNGEFLCAEDLLILNNPIEWLSSPIMNVYAEYLNVRDENKRKPGERACVAITTFLYDCLTSKDYTGSDSLMKFVKRLNEYPPDTLKRVLFPLHVPQHWIRLVLDMVDEKFYIFNSLREQIYYRDVVPLIRYLERLYISMWDFDVSKFSVVEVEKRPLQLNSNDCGLFVLKEMDCLARDVPPEFSQADIELMRGQLLEDFLEGRCGTVLNL
ncbi:uncharacterized protein LOC143853969 [Tasmannia lanceolata]|uniref:uncharacterized protein LOC143853969 n=1 Tax=Tasmannia lanceolata TaxID=3420 RepID=UPI00406454AC